MHLSGLLCIHSIGIKDPMCHGNFGAFGILITFWAKSSALEKSLCFEYCTTFYLKQALFSDLQRKQTKIEKIT